MYRSSVDFFELLAVRYEPLAGHDITHPERLLAYSLRCEIL